MKKINIFFSLLLLTIFTLVSVSCNRPTDQIIVLYYSDPQAMYLIPISTTLKLKYQTEKISKATQLEPFINELRLSRGDKSLHSCIPNNIKIADISISKEEKQINLKLEITSENKRLGDTTEQLMIGALVNTFTELKNYNKIKIDPGNLETDIDYSEPFTRNDWQNLWYTDSEIGEKNSLATVYWLSKDKKYFVPITVPIDKNDISSLLKELQKGPDGNRKTFLSNSIEPALDIIIKAVNLNHIDIELKSKEKLSRSRYEDAKKAVLLTVDEFNTFDTIKFITPDATEQEIINLNEINPRKSINRIEFFAANPK